MRTLILAAVMIGLCSPIGCKKVKAPQLSYGSFTEFQPAGGKFIVQMPGKPKKALLSEAGIEIVMYSVQEPDGMYAVAYSNEAIPADESASQIRSHIDGAFELILRKQGATLTSESNITLAGIFPGREFKAKLPQFDSVEHARFYAVDGRVYRLTVIGTQGYVASPETFTFFDSFAVTPSAPLWADDAEDKAVAYVEKLGGRVTRDEKRPGKPVIAVNLSFIAVTDAGLKELAPLKNLEELELSHTQVTDSGLKELVPLKNLTTLSLSYTQLTDAGLKGLAPLENLTYLGLGSTPVTDAGLKELAPLKNLTALGLTNTKVTDAGLKELAPLKNLTALYVSYTQVTDGGLKELAPLKNLTNLGLSATQVTDGGLKELAPLENLIYLDLSGTKVTDAGVKEIQKTLPKCEIQK